MNLQRIDESLAEYDGKLTQETAAQLTLLRALWGIMARTSIQAKGLYQTPSEDDLVQDLLEGQPFFANHPVEVDLESLADAVELLLACTLDSGAYPPEVASAMRALNVRQLILISDEKLASVDPEQYLNSLIQAMQTYGVNGLQVTLLAGIVSMALRALIEPAAEACMKTVPEETLRQVNSSSCPVCGGRPTLGLLYEGKSGRILGRRLACTQCGTEWDYAWPTCPHCETAELEKLGYRTLEGDSKHRIEYCDNCGNYLRAAVVPNQGVYSIDVEDAVMAVLDSYAQVADNGATQ